MPLPSPTSLNLDLHLSGAGRPAASFARLWISLWAQPHVPNELLEMCRLTLARQHRDEEEIAAANPHLPAGIPSSERHALVLAGNTGDAAFSPEEQAVLEFAEVYGLDAQSITDELAAQVARALGEQGLVFLIEALGCIDGRIRAARCLRDLAAAASARETAHAV